MNLQNEIGTKSVALKSDWAFIDIATAGRTGAVRRPTLLFGALAALMGAVIHL